MLYEKKYTYKTTWAYHHHELEVVFIKKVFSNPIIKPLTKENNMYDILLYSEIPKYHFKI